jgi:hypothetical protein
MKLMISSARCKCGQGHHKTADRNLSAFCRRNRCDTAARLCWLGFQAFGGGIEKDTIEGMPSLRVRTKTCPLFAVDMSGIIASHVQTERASVVSSSSKRLSLCQRSRLFPNRGNRTSHLCSWRGVRALRHRRSGCRGVYDDHAVGIRIRESNRNRPVIRLLRPESPPLPGAVACWRDKRLGTWAGTAVGWFQECERAWT